MTDVKSIRGSTQIVAVLGHPVAHSLSPIIHNVGFESLGIDWAYVAFDVQQGDLGQAFSSARSLGLRGLSLTMPHKTDAADLVHSLSAGASQLRSVNTVQILPDGHFVGHSTDGAGLVASLRADGVVLTGQAVLVLGAGGAARSVVDALHKTDCSRIVIANRTPSSAQLACDLAPGKSRYIDSTDEQLMANAIVSNDIIINATSVGMAATRDDLLAVPLDTRVLNQGHIVIDLVYHPVETPLLVLAREAGCQTFNGLGMLVHQAALQQQIWTGMMPDVRLMANAVSQALQ